MSLICLRRLLATQSGDSVLDQFPSSLTVFRGMKYFGGNLQTGKKETSKFGQGIYTIVQNLVTLQHVCGYNYA